MFCSSYYIVRFLNVDTHLNDKKHLNVDLSYKIWVNLLCILKLKYAEQLFLAVWKL